MKSSTKIAAYSSGDARSAYNALEVAASLALQSVAASLARQSNVETRLAAAPAGAARSPMRSSTKRSRSAFSSTTRSGEEHYNLISALHKSVRNSDPDAALYWLGRMLEAGEDPLYIARRVVRMAVEDIGLAEPNALALCMAARDAVDFIGMPEGNLALAQAIVYLCVAPEIERALHRLWSRSAGRGTHRRRARPAAPAQRTNRPDEESGLRQGLPVRPRCGRKSCGHAVPARQPEWPLYYHPTNEGVEKRIRERLEEIKRRRSQAGKGVSSTPKTESGA